MRRGAVSFRMPHTDFAALPDRARLWVFAADTPVADPSPLLQAVDAHLSQWAAHGVPLLCARDWREDRFLAIAVDEAATGASGCSIDGLFRTIGRVQSAIGADLLASGRVAWRDQQGRIRVSTQAEFAAGVAAGDVTKDTTVFETLTETVGGWRAAFEKRAEESWARRLVS
jgi:hypothetical protein